MQAILKNENKRSYSGRANLIDSVIYVRRTSKYVEKKLIGRFRGRRSGI